MCWNVRKSSLLTSIDKKKKWAENILHPGTRTKFEIYKVKELRSCIDHAMYEV